MTDFKSIMDQNPVFTVLTPSKREAVLTEALARRYHKGEIIACAGELWPYLFVVTSGGIDAWKESSEGRSLVVTTFHPGDLFWGLAFFYEEAPMLVTLKARLATELMLWPRERLLPFLKENGEMSWELSRLMIEKMTRASQILEEMTFQPVAGRLAKLLLETMPKDASGPTTRSLTLDEMAARIGSTREMVCRFLHKFADDGLIDITRTEFRLADPQALAQLASHPRR